MIAYRDDLPVGWVSVSPRSDLVRLGQSRDLRSSDHPADEGTWAIACFYTYRSASRTGVGTALLHAAVDQAVDHRASAVEAYPVKVGNVDPYTGYDLMFERAGFRQIELGRGLGRSLWRRELA